MISSSDPRASAIISGTTMTEVGYSTMKVVMKNIKCVILEKR